MLPQGTVFVTGAGVSVAAGLATYREQGSAWRDSRVEELSHSSRYGNHLDELVPHWYRLATEFQAVSPTLFHEYLAREQFPVLTQNVDGLHGRAGSPKVWEVHGSMQRWGNLRRSHLFPVGELVVHEQEGTLVCEHPQWGKRVRPDVVLFGEKPRYVREAVRLLRLAPLVVFAGTSGNVVPVSSWASLNPRTVLVDPVPWEDMTPFVKHHQMTSEEWVAAGAPGVE